MIRSIVVIICAVFLLAACGQEPQVTNAALVAKNLQTFNDCIKDQLHCEGAFAKRHKGIIVKITNSCSASCNSDQMGVAWVKIRMESKSPPWLPSSVDWIVLPADTAAWEKAAIAYERQFLPRM